MVFSLLVANRFKRLLDLFRRRGQIALETGKWVGVESHIKLILFYFIFLKGIKTSSRPNTIRDVARDSVYTYRYELASLGMALDHNK